MGHMTSHDYHVTHTINSAGSHLITAANFCMNGKLAVAGTYDGRCIFYETEVSIISMPLKSMIN